MWCYCASMFELSLSKEQSETKVASLYTCFGLNQNGDYITQVQFQCLCGGFRMQSPTTSLCSCCFMSLWGYGIVCWFGQRMEMGGVNGVECVSIAEQSACCFYHTPCSSIKDVIKNMHNYQLVRPSCECSRFKCYCSVFYRILKYVLLKRKVLQLLCSGITIKSPQVISLFFAKTVHCKNSFALSLDFSKLFYRYFTFKKEDCFTVRNVTLYCIKYLR